MRFLLILAIIYFIFYFFIRLIPWLLRRHVKKMSKNMEQQNKENHSGRKEGEVHIDYIPQNENDKEDDNHDDTGEYIDFEEVEE